MDRETAIRQESAPPKIFCHIIQISSKVMDLQGIMLRKHIMKGLNKWARGPEGRIGIRGTVENLPNNIVEVKYWPGGKSPGDVETLCGRYWKSMRYLGGRWESPEKMPGRIMEPYP